MLDADVRRVDPLGQVRRQRLGDLLVQAAAEAILRARAEDAQGGVRGGGAVAHLAGVADLRQVEGLAPGLAAQRAQSLDVLLDEHLVGVEEHQPVAGGGVEGGVARLREGARPLALDHARAERARDLDRAVARAGVDDHDLVDRRGGGGEAARQHLLLVLDDHAEAEPQPLGRPRACGDALRALRQLGEGDGDRPREGGLAAGAPAARDLVEVAGDVRQLGVEPARRVEERLRRIEAPELVEQDAGVVEQDRLARLLLQQRERRARGGEVDARDLRALGVAARVQRRLDERDPCAVAPMHVGDRRRLGEQRPVALEIAPVQARGRGARGVVRCGGCVRGSGGEAERHAGYLQRWTDNRGHRPRPASPEPLGRSGCKPWGFGARALGRRAGSPVT